MKNNFYRRQFIILSVFVLLSITASLMSPHSRSQEMRVETAASPSLTFTVTSTSNATSPGTLRQAINDANANPGLDTIAFNIAGAGIQTLTITSVLPTITSPVMIDGTTQPGYAGTPLIFIRGSGTSEALKITAGGSTLKGLTFGNFDGTTNDGAVWLGTNGGNVITGCTFGIRGDNVADTNGNHNIVIDATADNRIGGATPAERNYFGGDTFNRGVLIKNGASGNRIVGNRFGTAPNGQPIPMNMSINILNSPNNLIGGPAGTTPGGACTGECNVISGNFDTVGAVNINGSGATGNIVAGNFIGLLADGQTVNVNRIAGVRVTGAPGNRIGGTAPAERNVITGNGLAGIIVESAGSTGNIVTGNYMGVKTDGVSTTSTTATTSAEGILLFNSAGTRIGGTAASERNVISGNRNGILSTGSSNNVIQGNYIGTDATGMLRSTTLSHGLQIVGGGNNTIGGITGTTLGGPCTGACNVISGNGLDGASDGINLSSNGNTIDGNYIGLNAAGMAAILNGRTPDGTTFNGKAIRLINASDNMIGSQSGGLPTAPDQSPTSMDNSPSTMYCVQDDKPPHDYIQFDDVFFAYVAVYCNRFPGSVVGSGLGIVDALPGGGVRFRGAAGGSFVEAIVYPQAGIGLGFFNAMLENRSPLFPEGVIGAYSSFRDTNIANSPCSCPMTGEQGQAGSTEAGGDPGSDRNQFGGGLYNTRADGMRLVEDEEHPALLGYAGSSRHKASTSGPIGMVVQPAIRFAGFSSDNRVENMRISTNASRSGISVIENSDDITISDVQFTQAAETPPISVTAGANDNLPSPTINTIEKTGTDSFSITASISGAPASTNIRIGLYVTNRINNGEGGFFFVLRGDTRTIDLVTDAQGNGSKTEIFSGIDALQIGHHEFLKATATIFTAGSPEVLGSTSEMSMAVRVPGASISGRVTAPDGRGLRNAVISITDSVSGIRRTALTSSFGFYVFDDVSLYRSYTIAVSSKRYRFASQTAFPLNDLFNVDFTGLE